MLHKIKLLILHFAVRMSKKGEHVFHMAYLGMVSYQADHGYKYAAGALLICIAVNAFVGEE